MNHKIPQVSKRAKYEIDALINLCPPNRIQVQGSESDSLKEIAKDMETLSRQTKWPTNRQYTETSIDQQLRNNPDIHNDRDCEIEPQLPSLNKLGVMRDEILPPITDSSRRSYPVSSFRAQRQGYLEDYVPPEHVEPNLS